MGLQSKTSTGFLNYALYRAIHGIYDLTYGLEIGLFNVRRFDHVCSTAV